MCNRRKGGRTPSRPACTCMRAPRRPGVGARDPHHGRPAQRARELARLPLLERRARRHLSRCPRASPPSIRRWAIEGGRITIEGTGFTLDEARLPEVRIGGVPARVVYASPTRLAAIVPAGLAEGGPAPVRVEGVAGETPLVDVAATLRHRPAPGRQSGVRSPTATSTSPTAARAASRCPSASSACVPTARAKASRSGIVNPTSMALGPDGQLYVSSRFEGTVYRVAPDGTTDAVRHRSRRRVRARVRARRRAVRRRSIRHHLPRHRRRSRDDLRLAAAERRGVPPRDGPRRRALRHGADALLLRRRLPHRLRRHGDDALRRIRTAAGAGVRSGADRSSSSRRSPESSGLYRLPPEGDPELVLAAPALVGVAFDGRGHVVVSSNDTAYRLTRALHQPARSAA